MTMTRDDQLEMVARAISGKWPDWSKDSHELYIPGIDYKFTRSEVEAKRREITGEPDDKDAPEWACFKGQCWLGEWEWYEISPTPDDNKGYFSHHKRGLFSGCKGEVLGDWRDTLKPVKREPEVTPEEDEAFDAMARNGESIGAVDFVHGNLYESVTRKDVKSKFVAPVIGDPTSGVFVDENGYYESALSDMKPALSERERFESDCEKILDNETWDLYGRIFDAIEEGRLPVPKVKR